MRRKLLFSVLVIAAVLLALGVHRLVDDGEPPLLSDTKTRAPANGASPGTSVAAGDPLALLAAWRAVGAADNSGVRTGGAVGEQGPGRPLAGDERFIGIGPRKVRAPSPGDPGDDSWRARGAKREDGMRGTRYRRPQRGQPTILTSGRRLGAAEIRLPERARARLGLRDQNSTVRAMVCVDRDGRPAEVRIADGTGVPEVDAWVARELFADRFRPLRRDGRRVAFCEEVTVVVPA
jgi:hypothetical protein